MFPFRFGEGAGGRGLHNKKQKMELLKTLNIDPSTLLVNIVGFLGLLFIAQKLVFLPIGKVIAERQADISKTYDTIDADKNAMEATRREYEQRLASIEEERREKVQKAIAEAQMTRDQIVTEAQARAKETVTRAQQEAAREQTEGMIALRAQIVDLALNATHKVIGDSLDPARQRKLIDDFIAAPPAPVVAPMTAATTGTSGGTARSYASVTDA